MKARPSFQFYPADWLRDPGLRSCSLGARGLWIDMLSFMHEAEPYGHLLLNGRLVDTMTLARMVGSDVRTVRRLCSELEAAGVFSKTEPGTIFSRRMVRDHQLRERRAQYGYLSEKHPDVPKRKDRGKDTLKDTLPPSLDPSIGGSPSSSSSSSSSEKKDIRARRTDVLNGHQGRFERFWAVYPRKKSKGDAEKVWAGLKPPPDEQLLSLMLSKIDQLKQTPDWKKEGGTFIPYPASWLRDKGWLDEVTSQQRERLPL